MSTGEKGDTCSSLCILGVNPLAASAGISQGGFDAPAWFCPIRSSSTSSPCSLPCPVASFHSSPRALITVPVSVSAAEAARASAEARFVWAAALFPCLPIPGR